jgi:hypothetical protein
MGATMCDRSHINRQQRRAARKRRADAHLMQMVADKDDESPVGVTLWIVENGVKIARRGYPDTPEAGTWVSLIAGTTVRDIGDYEGVEVIHEGHPGTGAGH